MSGGTHLGRPVVLFLCTGNSCRSQMAEAFGKALGNEHFEFWSAGTAPADQIHPLTIHVMAELGLDLRGQYPKSLVDAFARCDVRHLITVCDGAGAACPDVDAGITRDRWSLTDPAAFEGTADQRLAAFRAVRDEVGRLVREWLERSRGHNSRDARPQALRER